MAVNDAYALVVNFYEVFLRKPRDMAVMVTGHTAKICDLFEVVDQVLRMEVSQMHHHIHTGECIDKGRGQLADAVYVSVRNYTYFHDIYN